MRSLWEVHSLLPVGGSLLGDKNTLYNEERCIGCGVCVDVCPNDALRLVPRKDWEEPSPTYGDMVADMMANRLRGGPEAPHQEASGNTSTWQE